MTMINLNLARVVPAARAAFDAGRLGTACQYSAPCALGAALTNAERAQLVGFDRTSFDTLIDRGLVTSDAPQELLILQEAHDAWVRGSASRADFNRQLQALEARIP